jgi:hypothetical protein
MRGNPRADWTISDVEQSADSTVSSVDLHPVDHITRSHMRASPTILTIVARKPIKPVYIRLLVKLIEAIIAESEADE